ncbi:MAG: PBP1A family penicillin-binding protein [Vicinamibacteria bacterium]|nr:PBP1A family penicillin-binding protein [Vicinamibacteria bacterium]
MTLLRRGIERLSADLAGRPKTARAAVTATILVSWVAAIVLAWFTWDLLSAIPDRDHLRRVGDMAQATTLLDRQDRAVFTIFKEQRIEIPLAQMSPLLVKAIVSIEDQRFYEHQGVDTVRIAAAALSNLRQGNRAQGGSTLTQQLARQAFLTLDKSYVRKLKEVIVAAELEAEYSKDEILELYLNKVYFGDGLHGVEAASLGFFGKHASDLTLPEAALIAGLVKSPSTYAPTVNLKRAITRRDLVLQTMVSSGAITATELDQAKAAPVQLKSVLGRDDPHGAWFKEEVRRQLIARFGLDRVYEGGLKVYTTVDMAMQQAAELLVEDALIEVENRRASSRKKGEPADETPLEGALVALDPQTGHVRALVGGRSFESSQFNRAIQAKRQPGSAFKPFVFAAALEQGWSPASVIDRLDEPIQTLQGAWMPEDEHATTPSMTLRTALRTSSNRAAVRLLEEIGIPPTVEYARRLGVGLVPSVPSLALGTGEVTLEGMTAAFATFASAGVHRTPVFIRRVEDRDGQVIYEAPDDATQVVSETTAFLLSSMLSDVVNYGTAWKARRVGFVLPAAGKTGTTNDYVDAWFVGYTPKLVAGVWIGFDQPKTIIGGGYAGEIAVPLWGRFMKAATRGDRPEWFTTPKGLVGIAVCRISGSLPDEGCSDVEVVSDTGEVSHRSMVITDYFLQGKVPSQVCPLHPGRNMLATMAGWFGKDGPKPVAASELGLPTQSAPGVAAEPTAGPDTRRTVDAAKTGEEPAKKKRGFWSRVFGKGKQTPDPPRDGASPK